MLLNRSEILGRDKNKLTVIHNILQIFFAQAIELWATNEEVRPKSQQTYVEMVLGSY